MKNHKDAWQKHVLKPQITMVQTEDEEKCPGDVGLITTGFINEVNLECLSLYGYSLTGPQLICSATGGWA